MIMTVPNEETDTASLPIPTKESNTPGGRTTRRLLDAGIGF